MQIVARLLASMALLLAVACTPSAQFTDPKAEAKATADEYLKSRSLYDARRQVTVRDEKTEWVVVYHVPDGWTGGEQRVGIDKQSKKVIGFVAWQ
jgi:hypothetical protein